MNHHGLGEHKKKTAKTLRGHGFNPWWLSFVVFNILRVFLTPKYCRVERVVVEVRSWPRYYGYKKLIKNDHACEIDFLKKYLLLLLSL